MNNQPEGVRLSILKKLRIPALLGVGLVAASLVPSGASSHREAPLISEDPVADNTDVYAFVSPDNPNTVTLLSNFIPFEKPEGGPIFYNFGEDVLYQIHVDNNGDARPDVSYEWRFNTVVRNPNTFLYNTGPITDINDPDFNYRQFYDLFVTRNGVRQQIGSQLAVPPVHIGPKSTPNYEAVAAQAIHDVGNIKTFAGQRDDPFFIDVGAAFDLFTLRPFNDLHAIPGPKAPGVDQLAGMNIHTLGVQVPISDLTGGGDGSSIIGVYSQAKRQQTRVLQPRLAVGDTQSSFAGSFVNVSRLANPLVNELLIPIGGGPGRGEKDLYNASEPSADAQFLDRVLDPEPARLIDTLYPVDVPPPPRNDIATIFLTGIPGLNKPPNVNPSDLMRLNTSIAPGPGTPTGVLGGDNAGFPNGRRLADDVVDIELRALAGATPLTPAFVRSPNNLLGDGVNANDRPFLGSFPYVATPHQGFEHVHHKVGSLSPQPASPPAGATPPTSTPPTSTPPTTGAPTTTTTTPTQTSCTYPESYKQFLTPQQIAQASSVGITFCG